MKARRTSAIRDAATFRRALMRWYRGHGRHTLPWRLTRDPYAIFVSEVMLQQTQVERVRPYWEAWMARWPTAERLARAPLPEVIRAWSGLGYNRRAVNLHRAAAVMAARMPRTEAEWRELPGVGAYTAAAIVCFANGAPTAPVEANIGRVIARVGFGVASVSDAGVRAVGGAATELLPASGFRDHTLALMDLGAMVCMARRPACGDCPVSACCAWRLAGSPPSAPAEKPAPKFETTARYARGRIISALREGTADLAMLRERVGARHAGALSSYLSALEADGLIEPGADGWQLAGATAG